MVDPFCGLVRGQAEPELLRKGAITYLAERATEAVWHPVGFVQVRLGRSTSERVSLHLWHPRYRRPQNPQHVCHSHGWTLHSVVIAGHLTDVRYTVTRQTDGPHELHSVMYSGDQSVSVATGTRVIAVQRSQERLIAPTSYVIPAADFHRTEAPDDQISVTVVQNVKEPAIPGVNVRPVSGPKELAYLRGQLSEAEREDLFRECCDALAAA